MGRLRNRSRRQPQGRTCGEVTAFTVGTDDAEEVLRRALAMGADRAVHLCDDSFEHSDPWAIATALHRAMADQAFDLILCGAISSDGTSGHTGGMLAALLDLPQVALVTEIKVNGPTAEVRHEVEDGLERVVEVQLPAVITVQSGINEPRYVSIRGIRKVAGTEIPTLAASDLGGTTSNRVELEQMSMPPTGERAEILEGSIDTAVATLAARLREKGVLS